MLGALLAPLLAGAILVVGPDGAYGSIADAMLAASPGDTVEVHGGIHRGPVVVDRAVALTGVNAPVIDGGGHGTVVTLAAPGAALRGFVVRASGVDLNRADAGIAVRASGARVEENRLDDVLYGISLDNAGGSIVRGNSILGRDLPPPSRGDGLRLWNSPGVLLEGNEVDQTRDGVIWYSANVRVVGNRIEKGRYGLHLMYTDGIEIADNVLSGNSVGAYLMYSREVALRHNLLAASRGPSGFGLGLKDVDDVVAEENWLVDNRVGVWVDNSPRSLDAASLFHRNVFALNAIGLVLQPAVERNTLWDNTFADNLQQVSVQGGGVPRGNHWAREDRGNYWSDYRGFDADGDGIGDVPYRAESLAGDLMDRRPELRLFHFSLAADAVEFAARAFPGLRPPPRLVDDAPLVQSPEVPAPPGHREANPRPTMGLGIALLAAALGVLALTRAHPDHPAAQARRATGTTAVLRVAGLRKEFGRLVAVDGLDLVVAPGEAVALWGPNGAGKTTVLKCILGLLPCTGTITIAGTDARRRGRQARRAAGYVPQDVRLHDDLTVAETVAFYARLKRTAPRSAGELLALAGLADTTERLVGVLSGGMRQRLALVLALLADPPLLLLDEPTSNLDAASREQMLHLLGNLRQRGTAIVFASHRLDEVEALADRVLVLEDGRPAFTCRSDELAHRLGLRLAMRIRVERGDHTRAVAVLERGGLAPRPNGTSIGVAVLPSEKARPIGLLERAGIPVVDFALEEDVPTAAEEPWIR